MNILFVSAVLPYPLHSGGQIRIYNLLKELSKHHSISLYSFIRTEEEKKCLKELRFLRDVTVIKRGRGMQLKYLIPSIIGTYPLLLETYNNNDMKCAIAKAIASSKYDCIHIEPFYVYPSIPDTTLPLVVSEHNVEYEVYASYAGKVKFPIIRHIQLHDAEKLRHWETDILKKASSMTTVSVDDAEKLGEATGRSDITVVPNGVDTDYFTFEQKTFKKKKLSFVFIGNFRWIPNIDVLHKLLDDVWPVLHSANPESEFHIVGANIPEWAKRLSPKGVRFDGVVSDVRNAYRSADALIAPLSIAGGTKFKILEAFACGCPVIATQEGIAGIGGEVKDCVIIASTPKQIAAAVSDMYVRPEQWRTMCANARALVETKYSWPIIAEALSDVWKEAAS
jgi:glycosyltransferase involved in cell wall biosynthesis